MSNDNDPYGIADDLAGQETSADFARMDAQARAAEHRANVRQANALLNALDEYRRTMPDDVSAQDVRDMLDEVIPQIEGLFILLGLVEPPPAPKREGDLDDEIPF